MIKIGITGSLASGKTTARRSYLTEGVRFLVQIKQLKNFTGIKILSPYLQDNLK